MRFATSVALMGLSLWVVLGKRGAPGTAGGAPIWAARLHVNCASRTSCSLRARTQRAQDCPRAQRAIAAPPPFSRVGIRQVVAFGRAHEQRGEGRAVALGREQHEVRVEAREAAVGLLGGR